MLVGIMAMLVVSALALAACGGGSSSSSEPSSTTNAGSEGAGPGGSEGGPVGFNISEEQRSCLKEKGVELPEFKGGPGGKGGPPNMNSAAFKKQVKGYVACVRENGYELPEPNFSGEGPIFKKSESESAAFRKASEQCQGLFGRPRGGPGPEGQSSSGETEG